MDGFSLRHIPQHATHLLLPSRIQELILSIFAILCVSMDLTTSQEAVAKEIREDTDAHRRKAALEEHMFQKLLENSQMGGRRAQRVMEDNLAKAEQACLNADWQIQTLHKQKCADQQRSQGYYDVATLLRENRRKEVEVLNAMMEEEAQKWKEAEEKEFHLQSAKKASALSDASRKWFLRQETSAALEHEDELAKCGGTSYNPSTWEIEARASEVQGQPAQPENLSQIEGRI